MFFCRRLRYGCRAYPQRRCCAPSEGSQQALRQGGRAQRLRQERAPCGLEPLGGKQAALPAPAKPRRVQNRTREIRSGSSALRPFLLAATPPQTAKPRPKEPSAVQAGRAELATLMECNPLQAGQFRRPPCFRVAAAPRPAGRKVRAALPLSDKRKDIVPQVRGTDCTENLRHVSCRFRKRRAPLRSEPVLGRQPGKSLSTAQRRAALIPVHGIRPGDAAGGPGLPGPARLRAPGRIFFCCWSGSRLRPVLSSWSGRRPFGRGCGSGAAAFRSSGGGILRRDVLSGGHWIRVRRIGPAAARGRQGLDCREPCRSGPGGSAGACLCIRPAMRRRGGHGFPARASASCNCFLSLAALPRRHSTQARLLFKCGSSGMSGWAFR